MTALRVLLLFALLAAGAKLGAAAEPTVAPTPRVLDSASTDRARLTMHVSGKLIQSIVTHPRDETQPVVDTILDARVCGMARTKSCVTAELVPDSSGASVDLVITGVTYTDSIAYQKPVKLYTVGTMPLVVRKRIGINDHGIFAATPLVQVRAHTAVRKIMDMRDTGESPFSEQALKQFYENLPEATAEVERKARRRITTQLESQLLPQLSDAQQKYAEARKWVEANLEARLDRLQFWTTASMANVAMDLARTDPLEKVAAPPPMPTGADAGVRLHSSLINDVAQGILGGKTFTLDELSTLGENLGEILKGKTKGASTPATRGVGSAVALSGQPAQPTQPKDDEAISITFARKLPVVVSFANQGFKVALQTENYRMGGADYQGFRVGASYKIERRNGKVTVAREGAVDVQPLGQPSGKQKKLPKVEQTFLREAFEKAFIERLTLPEVEIPPPWDRLGTMLLEDLEMRDNWLLVAWQRKT